MKTLFNTAIKNLEGLSQSVSIQQINERFQTSVIESISRIVLESLYILEPGTLIHRQHLNYCPIISR